MTQSKLKVLNKNVRSSVADKRDAQDPNPSHQGNANSRSGDLKKFDAFHQAAIADAENGKGPHANDPLAPCVTYVKWVLNNYQSDSSVLRKAVETTCRRFAKNPRYRDDVRLARLWVRYADMRPDKLDVYSYMSRHKIGETAAIFYESWAATLERMRHFDKAEKVYCLGREKRAQPAERLAQRQNEYLNRMAARAKRADKLKREERIRSLNQDLHEAPQDSQVSSKSRSSNSSDSRSDILESLSGKQDQFGPITSDPKPLSSVASDHAVRTMLAPHSTVSLSCEASEGYASTSVTSEHSKVPPPNEQGEQVFLQSGHNGRSSNKNPASHRQVEDNKTAPGCGQPTNCKAGTQLQKPAFKRLKAEQGSGAMSCTIYEENGNWSQNIVEGRVATDSNAVQSELLRESPTRAEENKVPVDEVAVPSEFLREIPVTSEENRVRTYKNNVLSERLLESPVRADAAHGSSVSNGVKRFPLKLRSVEPCSVDVQAPYHTGSQLLDQLQGAGQSSNSIKMNQPPSPTINTKLAMQEVEECFNKTITVGHHSSRKPVNAKNSDSFDDREAKKENEAEKEIEAFSVYCDDAGEPSAQRATQPPQFEIFIDGEDENDQGVDKENDQDLEKENCEGPRAPPRAVSSPAHDPSLEQRVLRPLETTEEEEEHETEECAAVHCGASSEVSRAEMKGDKNQHLITLLCDWFKSQPTCQILKSEDPVCYSDMFDLDPQQGTLVSLDPHCVYVGSQKKSTVLLAEDLNNVYGLKDELELTDDIDDDNEPCLAVKVSDPENLWEFYIYRTLEERLTVDRFEGRIPRALAFFEGQAKSFMILDSIGMSSLADAQTMYGENGIPETLCAFLLSDLLKVLEAIHSASIIHNDVTLDNVLVRNSGVDLDAIEGSGENGGLDLTKEGVLLVDFNRSVDSRHVLIEGADAKELAQYVTEKVPVHQRDEYRKTEGNGWAFDGDCYSAAVCAAKLLHVTVDDVDKGDKILKYKSVWLDIFQRLCGLDSHAGKDDTIATMRGCREILERILRKEHWLRRNYRDLIVMLNIARSSGA